MTASTSVFRPHTQTPSVVSRTSSRLTRTFWHSRTRCSTGLNTSPDLDYVFLDETNHGLSVISGIRRGANETFALLECYAAYYYHHHHHHHHHLLTAIGLSAGGSSPTLVQTKIKITQKNKITKNNTKQQNNYKTIK